MAALGWRVLFYGSVCFVVTADRPAVRRGPPYPQWGSPIDRPHYEYRGVPFRPRGAGRGGYDQASRGGGGWFARRGGGPDNMTRMPPRRRPVSTNSRSRSRSHSKSSPRSRSRSKTRTTTSRSRSVETGTNRARKRDVSRLLFSSR